MTATDQNGNMNKTKKVYYNDRRNSRYPYNDQLKIEVIEKVCLKKNGKIKFPSPTTSIKSCVFTQDEQLIPKDQGNKHFSGNVTFVMIDPASEPHPRNVCIQAYIAQIEDCSINHRRAEDTIGELPFWEVGMAACRSSNSNSEKKDGTYLHILQTVICVDIVVLLY